MCIEVDKMPEDFGRSRTGAVPTPSRKPSGGSAPVPSRKPNVNGGSNWFEKTAVSLWDSTKNVFDRGLNSVVDFWEAEKMIDLTREQERARARKDQSFSGFAAPSGGGMMNNQAVTIAILAVAAYLAIKK